MWKLLYYGLNTCVWPVRKHQESEQLIKIDEQKIMRDVHIWKEPIELQIRFVTIGMVTKDSPWCNMEKDVANGTMTKKKVNWLEKKNLWHPDTWKMQTTYHQL